MSYQVIHRFYSNGKNRISWPINIIQCFVVSIKSKYRREIAVFSRKWEHLDVVRIIGDLGLITYSTITHTETTVTCNTFTGIQCERASFVFTLVEPKQEYIFRYGDCSNKLSSVKVATIHASPNFAIVYRHILFCIIIDTPSKCHFSVCWHTSVKF